METLLGLIFVVAGFVHWLIIGGVLTENAPAIITYFFHSLAVIDFVVAYCFLKRKYELHPVVYFVAVGQIIAHSYMIYLDQYTGYGSGVSTLSRYIEIIFAIFLIFYTRSLKRPPATI